jgi:hypothetical protein
VAGALAARLQPEERERICRQGAQKLFKIVCETTEINGLSGFTSPHDPLAPQVDALMSCLSPAQAALFVQQLLDAVNRTQERPSFPRAPLRASLLTALAEQLSVEELIDLLKHPTCQKENRRVVLRVLSRQIGPPAPEAPAVAALCGVALAEGLYPGGRRVFTDLWEAVDWLRQHHPEIDLSQPPRSRSLER